MIYRERLKQPNTSELSSEGDESESDAQELRAPLRGVNSKKEELAQCELLLTAVSGMTLTPGKC